MQISARVKSFEEIWAADKELLKKAAPDLNIKWDRPLPVNEEALEILRAKDNRWSSVMYPFCPTRASVDEVAKQMMTHLENTWGARFADYPDIEIVDPSDFLGRINELFSEAGKATGYGCPIITSPPTMTHSPMHGKILVPAKFLIRQGRSPNYDTDVVSGSFEVLEYDWAGRSSKK